MMIEKTNINRGVTFNVTCGHRTLSRDAGGGKPLFERSEFGLPSVFCFIFGAIAKNEDARVAKTFRKKHFVRKYLPFAVIFLSPLLAIANLQDSITCDGCRQIGLPDWQLMTNQCVVWSPSVGLEDPSSPYTRACVSSSTDYTLSIISDEGALLVQDTFRVERGELYVSLSADQEEPNICTADSIVLVSIVTSDTDYSLQWSTGDTLPIIEVRESGWYSLTVTNANCSVSERILVKADGDSLVQITTNDTDGIIDCEEQVELAVDENFRNYYWSNNGYYNTTTIDEAGEYTITVVDNKGCVRYGSILLEGKKNPEVTFNVSEEKYCPGDPAITLGAIVEGSESNTYTYSWSTGQTQSFINPTASGPYTLTVTGPTICPTEATFSVLDCEGNIRCQVTEEEIDSIQCAAPDDSPLFSNYTTISDLKPGDRFYANAFVVEVTSVRGNGPFNGTGVITVPYFDNARVNVELIDIEVNEDCQLKSGYVEAVGVGLELLSDEMISVLDDALDAVETIDDALEKAMDIVIALDKAISLIEPYLPPGVVADLVDAQDGFIDAVNNYEAALASGDPDAIEKAKEALDKAIDNLKKAKKDYKEAVAQFFKDLISVVVKLFSELAQECLLTDLQGAYDGTFDLLSVDIENFNGTPAEATQPPPNEDRGTIFYGSKDLGKLDIPALDPQVYAFYEKEMEYMLCMVIQQLSTELNTQQELETLNELFKEIGFDLLDVIGKGIQSGLPKDEIVNNLKTDMLTKLEELLEYLVYQR